MLLLLLYSFHIVSGRPGEILFDDDQAALLNNHCDIVAGEVNFDGECYKIGQR